MTVDLNVYRERRVHLGSFATHPRAEGLVDPEFPLVRRYNADTVEISFTPEICRTATVRFLKAYLAAESHLRASVLPSSRYSAAVLSPPDGQLPCNSFHADIRIEASLTASVDRASALLVVEILPPHVPRAVAIQLLSVNILPLRRVRIQFHWVQISVLDSPQSPAPRFDTTRIARILEETNRIWRQNGIQFEQSGSLRHMTLSEVRVPAHREGVEQDQPLNEPAGDIPQIQQRSYDARAVNVYWVDRITGGWIEPGYRGIAFAADDPFVVSGRIRKCILIALDDGDNSTFDIGDSYHSLTLAHELGHFFGLRHPHDPPWDVPASRVELMHNALSGGIIMPRDGWQNARASLDEQSEVEIR